MGGVNLRKRRKRVTAGIVLICGGILTLVLLLCVRLRPLVKTVALSEARNAAVRAMESAVAAHMAAGELDYERLVRLEKDETGVVTAASVDMRSLNRLQAALSGEILRKLTGPGAAEISVPLGNLFSAPLLSGRGPTVPVRILSVSDVEAKLRSSFTDAGINQTLHRIELELHATIHVLLPGGTAAEEVTDTVLAAETVIVGRVPESYMYFESDDNWDEALEQYDILS